MMIRILAASVATIALSAAAAPASTFRVDVVGSGIADLYIQYVVVPEEGGGYDLVPFSAPPRDDCGDVLGGCQGFVNIEDFGDESPRDWLRIVRATTGTAFFSASNFFDCKGLLTPLCMGNGDILGLSTFDAVANTFYAQSLFYGGGGTVADTAGLFYADDASLFFTAGGVTYFTDGLTAFNRIYASFTSVSVTAVPIQSSALFLLAGLGGLGALRLRARMKGPARSGSSCPKNKRTG
jgi:hypothetical protein